VIRRLRGEVIERTATSIVVDVQGVGYYVQVSKRAGHPIGGRVDIHIHTHVREDALALFGFSDELEREVFDLLLSVPSIGPVKAMAILETPPDELVLAVRGRDVALLAKLPGIGKKTAERMVVDLHDKFQALPLPSTPSGRPIAAHQSGLLGDLTSALVNLGYKPASAEHAAQKSVERLGPEAELQALLREALVQIARR
jgi:Holliday junction DNA helicase RuvA